MPQAILNLRAAGMPFRGIRASIAGGGGGGSSSYSLTGSSSAVAGTPTTYTVTLLSGSGGTVTPNDSYHAGTFSPTSVALSTGSPVATFTHTAVAAGPRTIATTNNAGMTDPSPIAVTVSRPAGAQAITAQWLTDNAAAKGGPPYVLGQSFTNGPNSYSAATYYYLQTDVSTPGSAFISLGGDVLFDQCGHNVTFGNLAFFGLPVNGEFESGSGTSVPNWNLTGAPTAEIVSSSLSYLFGNQALRFNAPAANATQVIISDTFSLPSGAVGIPCMAIVAPSTGGDQTVFGSLLIEVVDSGSSTTVATYTESLAYEGNFSNRTTNIAAKWSPASTGPFFVRITWTPSVSGKIMDIDHVSITAAFHYAFICNVDQENWYSALPAAIQALYTASSPHFYGFGVVNSIPGTGTIAKGANLGYAGGIAYVTYLRDYATFLDLTCTMNGDNSPAAISSGGIGNGAGGPLTVSNCSFAYANCINGDHYLARGVVSISNNAAGPATIANNTFTGFPQHGVMISEGPATTGQHLVIGNTFSGNATVADSYSIQVGAASNVRATQNTVSTTNGYGVGLDQYAGTGFDLTNVEIDHNAITYAVLPNRESGNQGVAYGIKHRNTSGGGTDGLMTVLIHDNTIRCNVNSGGMTNGQCLFFEQLDSGDNRNIGKGSLVYNNTLTCVVNTPDTSYVGSALNIYGSTPGVDVGFWGNTLATNDTSLWIGGVNANHVSGLTVMGNTFSRWTSSGDQTRPYRAILVGLATGQTVDTTYVFDPVFANGASLGVTFWGPGSMAIGVGYTGTVHVQTSGGVAQSGASVTLTNAAGSGGGAATAFAGINAATRTYPSSSNTGTTDGSGNLAGISIVTDTYASQGIVGPYTPTHTALAPIHFAATSGGLSGSADATPTTGGTTTLTVA